MKTWRLLIASILGLGLTMAAVFFSLTSRAAPERSFTGAYAPVGNLTLDPPRNSHTAPLTTTVSITYDEPISAATVTSRTFAVHGMQSGLVTATHGVSGGKIIVTSTRPFHQGELIYAIATTGTLGLDGAEPIFSTQWQFNAGQVVSRCFGGFTNIDAELTDVEWGSAAWGDYDNDGDLDILLAGNDAPYPLQNPVARVYRNDAGCFTDIGAGLTETWYSSAAWGDFDNDGDLDILLTGSHSTIGWNPISKIYRNDGPLAGSRWIFTDIHAELTGAGGGSVAWGDYDNDGDLDILLTGRPLTDTHVSLIYRNDGGNPSGGWTFTDIGAGSTLTGVASSAVAWGDYDDDGDLDILLTGNSSTFPDWNPVSVVYRNDGSDFSGGWIFTDIDAGLPGVHYSSVAWGDYDDDGDLDILLTGDTSYLYWDPVSVVYRNDNGSFTDIGAGLAEVWASSAVWGDYDNDGDLDILLTGADEIGGIVSRIYRNDLSAGLERSFTDVGARLPDISASSVAWGDYDGDSDLDILLTGRTGSGTYGSLVYRNDDCSTSDLALVKTVTTPSTESSQVPVASPGDTITYTLTFFNRGIFTATHVVITDTLPLSVVTTLVVSSGVAITDTGASPPYVWQVQDLAPGTGGTITITGQVSSTLGIGTILTNTATITTTVVDSDPTDNTSDASVTVKRYLYPMLLHPPRNSHTAPPDTTVSITYNEPIDAATVTNHTFAVHGMQSGLVMATHNVSGGTITAIPPHTFYQGELVYAIATTDILDLYGTEPLSATQWQFNAGTVAPRCVAGFADIGAGLPDIWSSSAAWGDYDNDGDLDVLLTGEDTNWHPVSRVYRNDDGSFNDIGAALTDVASGSVAWGDYDSDGDLDILLTGKSSGSLVSRVYRNDGGSFINSGIALIGVEDSSVAWGDYDNDGDLDVLLTGRRGRYPDGELASIVYRNDGPSAGSGWTFTYVDAGLTGVHSSSAAWGDYDNDGDLDIVITGYDSDWRRISRVYRNDGDHLSGGWTFTDIDAGLTAVASGSVAWGDYDNDGDLDILLTGRTRSTDVSQVYRNDGADLSGEWTFTNISAGLTGVSGSAAVWGDYDNDGDLDVLLAGAITTIENPISRVYRNDGPSAGSGWVFTDIGAGLPDVWTDSAAWGDYDNDGDLDVLLVGVSLIYRNDDCSTDLEIVKAVTTPSTGSGQVQIAAPGDTITYTLAFSNSGTLTATQVVIIDAIPSFILTPQIVSSGAEIIDTGASPPYVWDVADLAPGEGGVITITGQINPALSGGVTFINTATITTPVEDVDATNNTSETSVTIRKPPVAMLLQPSRNTHTAPLVTAVSITYDEPIDATTVTSRTFAVHGMQSGLVTASHGIADAGSRIIATPARPFHQGELVYAIATTGTLGLDGAEPLSATQWQFNAGLVAPRCVAGFADVDTGLPDVWGSSVAWGDYDNDGDLDILLAKYDGSRVYRNDGPFAGWTFTDSGAELAGSWNGPAAWGDYDNDGDLDILLGGDGSRVYRNDAGSFTDIGAGLASAENGSVAWGDYDNDGDLDILLTGEHWEPGIDYQYLSKIYRNDGANSSGGWTFTDIDAGLPGVAASSVAWGDYDDDGDLDILLTGGDGEHYISQIYRNDVPVTGPERNFTNIEAELMGVAGSSAAWGDYDNDGDLDILLTGVDDTDNVVSRIYRNDGASPPEGWNFTDIGAELPDVGVSSVAWGDYDNDGNLDILLIGVSNADPWTVVSRIYRNDGPAEGWVFVDSGVELADVYDGSVAWGDYDNDGDLDILLTGGSDPPGRHRSWRWDTSLTRENDNGPVFRIYRNDDCSDLAIIKAVTPRVAIPGDAITYTLIFSNTDGVTATGVLITDAVPIGVVVDSVVSSGVAITDTSAGPPYVCQVQDLTPGAGGIITITGVLSSNLPAGVLANTAIIATGTMDSDPSDNSDTAVVVVVNVLPVATNDGYTTDEDVPLVVVAPGTLGNDTDANGDPLTATLDSGPTYGTLDLNADGSFIYTPTLNLNGVVTFTYQAYDGMANSNPATVVITVTALNDAPVALDDSYTTNEDDPLTINAPGVLDNDDDADGDRLIAMLDSGPTSGTLTFNPDGSFAYTPTLDFRGVDTFIYYADDGITSSNTATVVITVTAVNNAPVAMDDGYAIVENTPLAVAVPGVLSNDDDVDGDTLVAVLDNEPISGILTFNPDGSFVYTPTLNGIITFTYHANDGMVDSNVATVAISVNARPMAYAYLPLILKSRVVMPDMVVQSITVTIKDAEIVIKNQGDGPVNDEFWVDIYVNPDPIPTAVNEIWHDGRSDQGLVWGVTVDALPLMPGDVLTLTVGDTYYAPKHSVVSWPLPADTLVYVQVDSYNADTAYGAVLEDHELAGVEYNNIAGPVYPSVGAYIGSNARTMFLWSR